LKDFSFDGRIILKCILMNFGEIKQVLGLNAGSYENGNEPYCSIKDV
jgi:hypothetical protein